MDTCVHCGFCLATCPTYLLNGQEMDSPRGRIYLMRGGLQSRIEMSDAVVAHFDSCLGCLACETACPSGVRYAPLIEETRAAIERHHPRSAGSRLIRRALFLVLPHPRRLRALAALVGPARLLQRYRSVLAVLPGWVRSLIALAPTTRLRDAMRDVPELTPAVGARRGRVGLVTGCVQRVFFGRVNESTARVLAAEGLDVVAPRRQGCCGALALHAGLDEDARRSARELIRTFEAADLDSIVINAAGCGSAMKGYGELLKDDPVWAARARAFSAKVRDFSEVLAGLGPSRAPRRTAATRVAYHDACHLAHAQRIRLEPRQLLESIPGLTLVPLADADVCCGSAGIFSIVQPEMAAEIGRRKAARLAEAAPDVVVTTNPGCMLQMSAHARAAGHSFRVVHLAELLADCLAR